MNAAPTITATNVTEKAVHAIKWSALMEVVSRTANPAILVILARFLTPSDFGLMATAMIAISFAQLLADAGLSKALIQTKTDSEAAAGAAFWVNVALGLIIYTIFYSIAPLFADFFSIRGSSLVLRVLGLQIIIGAFSSVQQALFMRELNFRHLFWAKLFAALVPGVFSVPLACFGFGVWALVAGVLCGQIMNLIILWSYSKWRPKLKVDFSHAKQLCRFGLWVLAESFGAWLITWGDCLILGKFLGVYELGVYRTGWTLVTIIFGLALNPFLPILYPSLSRIQDDRLMLRRSFHKVNRIIIALAIPMGIGLLLLGPEIASVLFDTKWQGLGNVLSILGLMVGLSWLVGINSQMYSAIGKPDINSKILFVAVLYYIPCYILAARQGLDTFLYIRLAVSLLALPIHVFISYKLFNFDILYIWNDGKYSIISASIMGMFIVFSKLFIHYIFPDIPVLVNLFLFTTLGLGIYTLSLWLLDREFLNHIVALVKNINKN